MMRIRRTIVVVPSRIEPQFTHAQRSDARRCGIAGKAKFKGAGVRRQMAGKRVALLHKEFNDVAVDEKANGQGMIGCKLNRKLAPAFAIRVENTEFLVIQHDLPT